MTLHLQRRPTRNDATLGDLFVVHSDGELVPVCVTLEDAVREVKGHPVQDWKIPGHTAIPEGKYQVIVNMSARFRRILPLLLDVPGFSGIRIHAGNTIKDTEGCILPGMGSIGDSVVHSRDGYAKVWNIINPAITSGQRVWLTVKNDKAPSHEA